MEVDALGCELLGNWNRMRKEVIIIIKHNNNYRIPNMFSPLPGRATDLYNPGVGFGWMMHKLEPEEVADHISVLKHNFLRLWDH